MTELDRSDFMFYVGVVSAAVVAVALTLFVLLAVLSPEISVDLPSGRCRGAACGD